MSKSRVERVGSNVRLPWVVLLLTAASIAGRALGADPGWPREIRSEKGTIILYEPQVESMKGDLLKARSAFSASTWNAK